MLIQVQILQRRQLRVDRRVVVSHQLNTGQEIVVVELEALPLAQETHLLLLIQLQGFHKERQLLPVWPVRVLRAVIPDIGIIQVHVLLK